MAASEQHHPDRLDAPTDVATGRLTFKLTQPVPLGTPDQFLQWINRQLKSDIPKVTALRDGAPDSLKGVIESLLTITITIDDFVIETGREARCRFAASVDFAAQPLKLGGFLEIDRIGFRIEHRPATETPAPAR